MLRLQSTTVFRGPSVWSGTPVLCCKLGSASSGDPVTGELWGSLVDAVRKLRLDRSESLDFDSETAPHSADPVVWAGWLSIALQRLCGVPVVWSGQQSNLFAFEFLHERTGMVAAHLALRVLNHYLSGSEPEFDLEREVNRLAKLNRAYDHGPVGRAIAAEARCRGIPTCIVDPRGRIVELGSGRYRQRILGTMTSRTAALGDLISDDKLLANRFLAEAGFPVPAAMPARDAEQACERAAGMGYPVVLKPMDQADSVLVFVDIRDEFELRARFEIITQELNTPGRPLLLERFVPGNVYRALIVGDRVAGVFQRVPAHVFGDGASSIRQLVDRENADPRRQRAELRPIPVDAETLLVLERQQLLLDSIAEAGRRVELRPQIGHKRDGGLARDCTDELHPENARLLIQATRTIGLDVAGIDFVTRDCSRHMLADGGAIIEVNSRPDFERHLRPSEGIPRDGAPALLDLLFPPGAPVRARIVAVCGGPEAGQVVTRLGSEAAASGLSTAVVSGGVLTVDGLALGEQATNFQGARRALNHPMVELLVLEMPRDEIVAHGLPFDVCDLAMIADCPVAGQEGTMTPEAVLARVALARIEIRCFDRVDAQALDHAIDRLVADAARALGIAKG